MLKQRNMAGLLATVAGLLITASFLHVCTNAEHAVKLGSTEDHSGVYTVLICDRTAEGVTYRLVV